MIMKNQGETFICKPIPQNLSVPNSAKPNSNSATARTARYNFQTNVLPPRRRACVGAYVSRTRDARAYVRVWCCNGGV